MRADRPKTPHRWPWQTPALPHDYDDDLLGKTSTRITVTPTSAHRERYNWQVEVLFNGHRSPICWALGNPRRRPTPHAVSGRARDEATAWEQARAVVADWNSRKAAEQLRRSHTETQTIPQ